jgi:hypothetical protein
MLCRSWRLSTKTAPDPGGTRRPTDQGADTLRYPRASLRRIQGLPKKMVAVLSQPLDALEDPGWALDGGVSPWLRVQPPIQLGARGSCHSMGYRTLENADGGVIPTQARTQREKHRIGDKCHK